MYTYIYIYTHKNWIFKILIRLITFSNWKHSLNIFKICLYSAPNKNARFVENNSLRLNVLNTYYTSYITPFFILNYKNR